MKGRLYVVEMALGMLAVCHMIAGMLSIGYLPYMRAVLAIIMAVFVLIVRRQRYNPLIAVAAFLIGGNVGIIIFDFVQPDRLFIRVDRPAIRFLVALLIIGILELIVLLAFYLILRQKPIEQNPSAISSVAIVAPTDIHVYELECTIAGSVHYHVQAQYVMAQQL